MASYREKMIQFKKEHNTECGSVLECFADMLDNESKKEECKRCESFRTETMGEPICIKCGKEFKSPKKEECKYHSNAGGTQNLYPCTCPKKEPKPEIGKMKSIFNPVSKCDIRYEIVCEKVNEIIDFLDHHNE